MNTRVFISRALTTSLALALLGCQLQSAERTPKPTKTRRGADTVACFTHYYGGFLGDGNKDWDGTFYLKQNLSIVAHLPTRSEFYVCVYKLIPKEPGITNGINGLLDRIMELASADRVSSSSWETIQQRMGDPLPSTGTHLTNLNYLRAEFVGHRFDTDRYSKSDQVKIRAYLTCLSCDSPADLREKSLYLCAAAMIPIEVSHNEQQRLLNVLATFLQGLTLYQD